VQPSGFVVTAPAARAAPIKKPSILFVCPGKLGWLCVDLDYLAKMHKLGFEVDQSPILADVNRTRLWKYNTIVVFCVGIEHCNGGVQGVSTGNHAVGKHEIMTDLILEYIAAGGGVLLLPPETNVGLQMVWNLTEHLGAKLPAELIVETGLRPGRGSRGLF
jgi:hypothetical protein